MTINIYKLETSRYARPHLREHARESIDEKLVPTARKRPQLLDTTLITLHTRTKHNVGDTGKVDVQIARASISLTDKSKAIFSPLLELYVFGNSLEEM